MKSLTNKFAPFKLAVVALFATTLLLNGCKKDDDVTPSVGNVVASFQYEASLDNYLQVSFTNFSQNATSYLWDFGDGNTSTEKDPTHTFAAAGTYDVKLTASDGSGKSADRTETINITDPNSQLTLLAGSSTKTWYLRRQGIALGVGPGPGDNSYWSFGGVTPLGDRPCILDDQYIFKADGSFEFNSGGTIFIDSEGNGGWLGPNVAEGCFDDTDAANMTSVNGDDLSAFASGANYTFEYNTAAGTITLLGDGAYIGLANKTSTGDNYIPLSTKEYQVLRIAEGDIADSLDLSIVGADISWNFYLVSYKNEADLPAIPSTSPAANFSFTKDGNTVTFNNSSTNSTSYMWDFGDGSMSTEVSPVHTYATEGDFTVTLTAMDDNGKSDVKSEVVSISAAVFTGSVLSSASGKVWKLNGEASYIVGPAPGSGDWWPGLDANGVIERACQMDDEFIFFENGDFNYDAKGQVFAEEYMGGTNSCMDEADIPAPFNVLTSGNHNFEVTEAAGGNPATIRVIGEGAFIGWNKGFNGGEIAPGVAIPTEITYEVLDYTNSGGVEKLVITVDISGTGGAFWTITMTTE